MHVLADRMAASNAGRKVNFDRTLSCTLSDLGAIFSGRLHDGRLTDIAQADTPTAQMRLKLSSDDFLELVDGTLKVPAAWASGRIKIDAGMMDLVRLKSIF